MSKKPRLLVVDDSLDTLDILEQNLVSRGYDVVTATGARLAMELLAARPFDLVLTDLRMPEVDGLELVRFVRSRLPETEVMMITGYATIESAVEAVKLGAEEYLQKPFTDEELFAAVGRVLSKVESRRVAQGRFGLVGESLGMRKAIAAIRQATTHSRPVLILGEPGTGRRSAARAIAAGGDPRRPRLVEEDAAAQEDPRRAWSRLLEDEGTLLLVSGIEAADPETQETLLGLVTRDSPTGGRLLLSSIPLLSLLPERGAFRADLHARLATEQIVLPPLRERPGDVVSLADHFAGMLARRLGRERPRFADRALRAMAEYEWPGNVEELRATVFDALLRSGTTGVVDLDHLPVTIRERSQGAFDRSLDDVEREHLRRVLARTGGNKSRAAEILGIDRKTLREKIRACGLSDGDDSSGT
jgi:two-component system, NtrC family, response regulator HydG